MFDSVTQEVISNGFDLEGLDISRLPQKLSNDFAEIVSISTRLDSENSLIDNSELREIKEFMIRLSSTYESLAIINAGTESSRNSAFVAANAYGLLQRIEKLTNESNQSNLISSSWIGPILSSSLLYLYSGSLTDSREVSKELKDIEESLPYRNLILQIKLLSELNFVGISRADLESPDLNSCTSEFEKAEKTLFSMISEAIFLFSQTMIGDHVDGSYQEKLNLVKTLSKKNIIEDIDLAGDVLEPYIFSFDGPFLLSTLLGMACEELTEKSVLNVDCPQGVNAEAWDNYVKNLAKKRPVLWQNHIEAISNGLLNPNVSCVVSFPTGAGKSTISELKIATKSSRK